MPTYPGVQEVQSNPGSSLRLLTLYLFAGGETGVQSPQKKICSAAGCRQTLSASWLLGGKSSKQLRTHRGHR